MLTNEFVVTIMVTRKVLKMKISSRFSVATHIIAMLHIGKDVVSTSEVIAHSVNTNPVVIRRVIGMLKKAELVNVNAGCGGAYLLKPIEDITLLDIYKAVEVVKDGKLFQIHEQPDNHCIVGACIEDVLGNTLCKAQTAMEDVLQNVTMADIITSILEKIE